MAKSTGNRNGLSSREWQRCFGAKFAARIIEAAKHNKVKSCRSEHAPIAGASHSVKKIDKVTNLVDSAKAAS